MSRADVSVVRRRTKLAVLALACVFAQSIATAASDVADAAMRKDSARLRELLSAKADVNAAQPDGTTALHWAVYNADTATVSKLLSAGASPAALTGTGVTALAMACEAGNADMVKAL